jgi:hypothetical protein
MELAMQVNTASTAVRPLSASAMASLRRPEPALSRTKLERADRRVEDIPQELPELSPGMFERQAQRARQIAAKFMVNGMATSNLAGAASILGAMIASGELGGAGQPSLAQLKAALAYQRKVAAGTADETSLRKPVAIEA